MPPPYAVRRYRGYELVQWNDGGPWEICHVPTGAHVSTGLDEEDAVAIVDGWHLAL